MQDKPSLFVSGILLIASGILAILAVRIHDEALSWLKFIMILTACVLGFYGVVQLVGWIAWTVIEAKAEAARVALESAKARYPVVLATALANLGPGAVSILERSTIL